MITVSILINGKAIFTRSAHRRTKSHARKNKISRVLEDAYLLDTGEEIFHDTEKGVVVLAIKMLRTIKEIT